MNLDAFKNIRKDADLSAGKGKNGGIHNEASVMDNKLLAALTEVLPGLIPETPDLPGVSDEQKATIMLQMLLSHLGITPEEYSMVYHMYHAISGAIPEDAEDMDTDFGFPLYGRSRNTMVKRYTPMANASDKTLVLKIQMKNVIKPPMWREIEIPASFNFLQLHHAIQAVIGLTDSHLWQFNKTAYDSSLLIGTKMDSKNPFSLGLEYVTDDAESTPITKYLAEKDDKLEYIYDFGDDWIFTVKVQKVLDTPCLTPRCTKWKSDLNALEDIGGPYAYEDLRLLADDKAHLSKKAIKDLYDQYGGWYDTQKEFLEWIEESKFDQVTTNEELSSL